MRQAITINVLNEFCKIEIINNDNAIEEIIDEYKPAVAASHFSAGSFNLLYKGIEPLFLYRLIPQLNTQPIFQQATSILKGLGYNFVSEHELLEQQYSSGLNTRNSNHLKLMLSEIVRQSN
jgi:hypothetical protein